jgi:hypothetical protein
MTPGRLSELAASAGQPGDEADGSSPGTMPITASGHPFAAAVPGPEHDETDPAVDAGGTVWRAAS